MQLPFLQRLVPSLRIVPLLMGSQSREEVDALAEALAAALAGRDVAARGLERPLALPAGAGREPARRRGRRPTSPASTTRACMARLEAHHNVACGGGPIVAVMRAARALGADRATVLRYADSGDAGERDKSRVVGYVSAALVASAP